MMLSSERPWAASRVRDAGDVRSRHGGACVLVVVGAVSAGRGLALAERHGGDDVLAAHRQQRAARAGDGVELLVDGEVRERGARLALVRGDDAQRAGVECRRAAQGRHEVVARCGHDDHAVVTCVGDGVLDVRDLAGDHQGLDTGQRAQRQVDDVGAMVDRVTDAEGDVLEGAALLVEHLHGQDSGVGGHARDADAVVGHGRRGSGHVRAVGALGGLAGRRARLPIAVAARGGAAVEERRALHQLRREVGMVEVDTGINDADGRSGARGRGPRLLGVDLLRPPLVAVERVVGCGGSGRCQGKAAGDGGSEGSDPQGGLPASCRDEMEPAVAG